jgi:IMP dehydrogenase
LVDLSVSGFDDSVAKLLPNYPALTCPIVGSPMDTVISDAAAAVLADLGGFGVLHRYCSIDDAKKAYESFIRLMPSHFTSKDFPHVNSHNVMVAIGATGDYMERTAELYNAGCSAFCIDVAHGHHVSVKMALKALRDKYGKSIHIMTGNVATLDAFNDLADWGSDSIRVGVGGGSMCSTRIRTGHGIPTLQSVMDCGKSDRDVYVIADGGIRNSGDVVKALAAGVQAILSMTVD